MSNERKSISLIFPRFLDDFFAIKISEDYTIGNTPSFKDAESMICNFFVVQAQW